MFRLLPLGISWCCTLILVGVPLYAVYLLFNIESLAALVTMNANLPIQWPTVESSQLYGVWFGMAVYTGIGLTGIYYLRRVFNNFAKGELFTLKNSADIRRFSFLILTQALLTPIHIAFASVLLSLNHPPGQKMLSIAFGSNELKSIGVCLVMFVISNLLVEGHKLDAENRQFI